MGIDLNYPLRKKTSKKQSFSSKIVFQLGIFLFFCTFIIGFSIYILFSNNTFEMVSEVRPYSVIREVVPVPFKDNESSSAIDSGAVNDKVKIDPSKSVVFDKENADIQKRSTNLDHLPTIEERLLPSLTTKKILENNQEVKGEDQVYLSGKKSCFNIKGPRIAIVVSGLGISQTGTQSAINLLPSNITMAFASNGNSLKRWMTESTKKGQDTILQVPMQAFNEAYNDDDIYTLKITEKVNQLRNQLIYSLNRGTGYLGVMNYRGAMLLSHKTSVEVMFKEFANRGLLFFDDGSSARSLTRLLAPTLNLPYVVADLYLDDQVDRDKIREKLKELENIARKEGQAIGVAVAFDESIEVISQWLKQEHASDISIVPLSCLVKLSSSSQ
ncbi:divergent polysaccharide deacetylase family protein [Candidatus Liberibacter brunswickensis]|uniref:divergent polysaccharide deacetylase family protein n=1 Tax=Candidatus Liberibacter brunswickensis TaxID=1968796 RepID=UPI002FDFDB7D